MSYAKIVSDWNTNYIKLSYAPKIPKVSSKVDVVSSKIDYYCRIFDHESLSELSCDYFSNNDVVKYGSMLYSSKCNNEMWQYEDYDEDENLNDEINNIQRKHRCTIPKDYKLKIEEGEISKNDIICR
jgi:hypothetical protein